jgi:hypothetical protein
VDEKFLGIQSATVRSCPSPQVKRKRERRRTAADSPGRGLVAHELAHNSAPPATTTAGVTLRAHLVPG